MKTGTRKLVGWQKAKAERLDLGLAISRLSMQPGQTRTLEEIAAYCECTREAIRKIEKSALAKMKARLQIELQEAA